MDRRVINKLDIRQVRVPQVRFFGAIIGICVRNYSIKSFYLSFLLGMIWSGSCFINHKQAANILYQIKVKVSTLFYLYYIRCAVSHYPLLHKRISYSAAVMSFNGTVTTYSCTDPRLLRCISLWTLRPKSRELKCLLLSL